jgi:MarR family transcriptional regulator, organic hydroperoxide resistance regulator
MKEDNIDAIAMELSKLLPVLQQKLIKPFEQFAKSKISPMQFHVMFTLEEKGDLSMSQLSHELLTSKQQMTPIIDKLIDCGFVEREHDKLDRRVVKINLSSSGGQFLEKQRLEIFEMLKKKIQNLGNSNLNALHKAFLEIRRVIDKLP